MTRALPLPSVSETIFSSFSMKASEGLGSTSLSTRLDVFLIDALEIAGVGMIAIREGVVIEN